MVIISWKTSKLCVICDVCTCIICWMSVKSCASDEMITIYDVYLKYKHMYMYCYYIMRILEWISASLLLLNVLSSLNFIYVACTCSSAGNNIMLKYWKNTWLNFCRSNLSLSLINLANMFGLSSVFCDV